MHALALVLAGAAASVSLAGCADPWMDDGGIYYAGTTQPFVLCASSLDDQYHVTDVDLGYALSHAYRRGRTLHLYAHDPGVTVSLATIETVITMAAERDMPFVTYGQLGTGAHNGSLALSFDDDAVDDWTAMRPLLARFDARVTFFVTRYLEMTDAHRAQLHDLAADGHDIEYHTVSHQNAVEYVEAHGADAWIADEITPGLEAMRADGFPSTAFAYPYGARDDETDAALVPYFDHVRALRTTCPGR